MTCAHGTVIEGDGNQAQFCGNANVQVPFAVRKCNSYHKKGELWMHEMEAMAWILRKKKSGQIGFVRPMYDRHGNKNDEDE